MIYNIKPKQQIRAVQYTGDNVDEVKNFGKADIEEKWELLYLYNGNAGIYMQGIDKGDWIIETLNFYGERAYKVLTDEEFKEYWEVVS